MRMWMVDPRIMCRNHLLGEHVELHMLVSHLKSGKSIDGFIRNDLIEPGKIAMRHFLLTQEMKHRKYNHKSPLNFDMSLLKNYPKEQRLHKINREKSLIELTNRCPECWERYQDYVTEGN